MTDPTTGDALRMRDDEPNTPMIVLVGVIGAIILFVVIVVLQGVFYWAEEREFQRKVVAAPSEELAQARAAQRELLSSYGWVDEQAGRARIPIERAMELMAAESTPAR